MGIPLFIFYIIYMIFVVGFLFFTFFNVYHLARFGRLTISNIIIIAFYLFVSISILSISWFYINQFDWSAQIPVSIEVKSF